jgi:hypothetical protein
MGLRGRTRQPRNWTIPGSSEFEELVFGPRDTKNQAEYATAFPRIRRRWRNGGREAVMASQEFIGWRPLAWWLDRPIKERKLVEKDPKVRCEAEAILRLKLAGKHEREAIADRGLIAQQIAAMVEDMKAHPEDYR